MDLVTIQTFDNYFSANILLTRLQSAGFECYLKDEYTVTIDPILSNAIGGIKLVAKRSDEKEISKVLEELYSSTHTTIHCPKCGSHDLVNVPKQSAENIYKCNNCGYQSETLPEDISIENNP